MPIPEHEQITAILLAQEYALAEKYKICSTEQIPWTVSLNQLVHHVENNGFPGTWVHEKEGSADGIYILKRGSEHVLFEQERGEVRYKKEFRNKRSAIISVLEEHYLVGKTIK